MDWVCPDIVWVSSYLGLSLRVVAGGGGRFGCSAVGGCGWGTWGSSSVVWDALSSSVDESSPPLAISSWSATIRSFVVAVKVRDKKRGAGAPSERRLLPTLMIAATRTKKAVVNIFSYPQHAQFLAAAASPSSIPKLHGVPEVSEGKFLSCQRVF